MDPNRPPPITSGGIPGNASPIPAFGLFVQGPGATWWTPDGLEWYQQGTSTGAQLAMDVRDMPDNEEETEDDEDSGEDIDEDMNNHESEEGEIIDSYNSDESKESHEGTEAPREPRCWNRNPRNGTKPSLGFR